MEAALFLSGIAAIISLMWVIECHRLNNRKRGSDYYKATRKKTTN